MTVSTFPKFSTGFPVLAASCFLVGNAPAAVISNFDFTGPPWTAAKESNFATFATNAPSVDADANSVTSTLGNSGFTGGGYASYYIRDIDGGTVGVADGNDFVIFSSSDTPGAGMNLGGANQSSATNYVSFTVTPTIGFQTTYESLTLFAGTNGVDTVSFELRAWNGVTETSLGSQTHTSAASNEAVKPYTLNFADFTAASTTEFRLYGWDVSTPTANPANGGIRFDDIVLNGSTAVIVPEPSSAALMLFAGLGLIRRRR